MRLKQPSANIREHLLRDAIVKVIESLLEIRRSDGLLHSHVKELFEVGQGELVHWVDHAQLGNDEVEDGAASGHWDVEVTGAVYFLFDGGGLLQALLDLLAVDFTLFECLNECLVVQYHALTFGQERQYLILGLLERPLALRYTNHHFIPLLLNLGQFKLHNLPQQLILQPLKRNTEVNHRHLNVHFGQVVRIRHFRCDVELETRVVVEFAIAHTDELAVVLLVDLFLQDGVDGGLQTLLDVLDENGGAVGDGRLDGF